MKYKSKALSFLVVFAIVVALIVPALTAGAQECGLAEHRHTQGCYGSGDANTQLCNVDSTNTGHEYDDDCYEWVKSNTLLCGHNHSHENSCYAYVKGDLICNRAAGSPHEHTDACYGQGQSVLICGLTEHTRSGNCNETTVMESEEIAALNAGNENVAVAAEGITVDNMDNGLHKLLVDWYVYLDKTWTKVGSTRTGWLSHQNGSDYDHISEKQVLYILEKYGFVGGENGWKDLAYRKIQTYRAEPTFYPGIYEATGFADGDLNYYYQLSADDTVDSYCMYFAPNTEASVEDPNGTEQTLYSKFGNIINVYFLQIYDPLEHIYKAGEATPVAYGVHGTQVSMVVKNHPDMGSDHQVDQLLVTLPQETETEALSIVEGKDYCTLVTCTPYGVNTHRLLVRGHRIENESATPTDIKPQATQSELLMWIPLTVAPVLLILLIWLLIPSKKKRKKERE